MDDLHVVNPPGQDGRSCQYLAVVDQLDQLERAGSLAPALASASALDTAMVAWIAEHANDVTGLHGRREDMAAVSLLSDHWPAAELQSIIARNAQGDHFTLSSIAAMLKEIAGVHVDVLVFDWRGEAFDVIVRAPDIYGVRPTNRLRLAYTGAHYLSLVRWSPSLPCKPPSPSNSLLHPSRYTTPSLPPAPARPQQRIQAHAVNWSLGSSHFGKCSVGSVPSEHPQARTPTCFRTPTAASAGAFVCAPAALGHGLQLEPSMAKQHPPCHAKAKRARRRGVQVHLGHVARRQRQWRQSANGSSQTGMCHQQGPQVRIVQHAHVRVGTAWSAMRT